LEARNFLQFSSNSEKLKPRVSLMALAAPLELETDICFMISRRPSFPALVTMKSMAAAASA
jgi:hypothetical protein